MKNHERYSEEEAKVCSAALSRNPKAELTIILDALIFYKTGEGLNLGFSNG